jgi:hypothetical protein
VFVTSKAKTYELLMKAMRAACVDERRNKDAALPRRVSEERALHLEKVGAAIAREFLSSIGTIVIGRDEARTAARVGRSQPHAPRHRRANGFGLAIAERGGTSILLRLGIAVKS